MAIIINWTDRYNSVVSLVNDGIGITKAIKSVCKTKTTQSFYQNISKEQKLELGATKLCLSEGNQFKHLNKEFKLSY